MKSLTDIQMDGYETSQKIREFEQSGLLKSRSFAAGKRLPIIAVRIEGATFRKFYSTWFH